MRKSCDFGGFCASDVETAERSNEQFSLRLAPGL